MKKPKQLSKLEWFLEQKRLEAAEEEHAARDNEISRRNHQYRDYLPITNETYGLSGVELNKIRNNI